MAEEKPSTSEIAPNNAAGGWWGSWINSAKAKTSTVFEAVKKDLDELSTAVRAEASHVGAALESTLKFDEETSPVGTMKKSISSFLGQVSEVLAPTVENDESECILITHEGSVTLTGFPKHLADLQNNDKTYLEEPQEELASKYKLWLEIIEQDQFTQDRLAKHLENSEILNEKYLSLVPEKVPHMEFWKRYLFKRALLEDAIANAEIAEKRAKAEINSNAPVSPRKNTIQTEQPKRTCVEVSEGMTEDIIKQSEILDEPTAKVNDDLDEADAELEKELLNEDINWENEGISSNIELSEEEQIRLLEQYEQEIQEREKRKSQILEEGGINKLTKKPEKNSSPKKVPPTKTSSSNKTSNPKTKSENSKSQSNSVAQKDDTKMSKKDSPKTKTRQQSQQQQKQQTQKNKRVENITKEKEESASSTSDESWEKDFDMTESNI